MQHLDVPTGQSLADAINTYFVGVSNDLPAIDPNLLELAVLSSNEVDLLRYSTWYLFWYLLSKK